MSNDEEQRTVLADGATTSTNTVDEKPEEKEVSKTTKTTIKWSDLMYRDPCKHWSQTTARWLTSFPALLTHLHSEDYQAKMATKEKPWKKRLEMFNATLRGTPIDRAYVLILFRTRCNQGKSERKRRTGQGQRIFRTSASVQMQAL